MPLSEFVPFLLIALIFIVIPGPNILVIVATSLQAGSKRGLQTVAGCSAAMVIQLVIAGVATSWLVEGLTAGLYWLKWCGVFYLIYLGLRSLYQAYRNLPATSPTAASSFRRGFWVSLTNPKTILFFAALLPQFVNDEGSYPLQLALLSAAFWLLAAVIDSSYAMLAGKTKHYIAGPGYDRQQRVGSGILLLGASGFLANSNRLS